MPSLSSSKSQASEIPSPSASAVKTVTIVGFEVPLQPKLVIVTE